jgi:hypothetical protein
MKYAKIVNKKITKYPYLSLQTDYPNVSFPSPLSESILAEYGVYIVHETEMPEKKWNETVVEDMPVYEGGKWIQKWKILPIDKEERQKRLDNELKNIKSIRNKLLADCDWTQLPDADLSGKKKAEWSEYRKQLRDLPNKSSVIKNPFSVKWPKVPE